jgi:hypothetical protein
MISSVHILTARNLLFKKAAVVPTHKSDCDATKLLRKPIAGIKNKSNFISGQSVNAGKW